MLDTELLSEVQLTVIEPADGGLTFPSGLWEPAEVLNYLNQRQNQFIKESQIIVGTNILAVAPGQLKVDLPEDWMTTIAVTFRRLATGIYYPMYPADAFVADYASPLWPTATTAIPLCWTDGETEMASLRLIPGSTEAGQLYLVYVGLAEECLGTGQLLDTPDDFCVFLRYGVLADMFAKQGRGYDPLRAEACEARFREGIDLAKGVVTGWAG